MSLIIKKINALVALMLYAPVVLMVIAGKWKAYPLVKEDRGDFMGGVLFYGITLTVVFSLLMPRLKVVYQLIIGLLFGSIGLVFVHSCLSGMLVAGIIAGMCLHLVLYIGFVLYTGETEKVN